MGLRKFGEVSGLVMGNETGPARESFSTQQRARLDGSLGSRELAGKFMQEPVFILTPEVGALCVLMWMTESQEEDGNRKGLTHPPSLEL